VWEGLISENLENTGSSDFPRIKLIGTAKALLALQAHSKPLLIATAHPESLLFLEAMTPRGFPIAT